MPLTEVSVSTPTITSNGDNRNSQQNGESLQATSISSSSSSSSSTTVAAAKKKTSAGGAKPETMSSPSRRPSRRAKVNAEQKLSELSAYQLLRDNDLFSAKRPDRAETLLKKVSRDTSFSEAATEAGSKRPSRGLSSGKPWKRSRRESDSPECILLSSDDDGDDGRPAMVVSSRNSSSNTSRKVVAQTVYMTLPNGGLSGNPTPSNMFIRRPNPDGTHTLMMIVGPATSRQQQPLQLPNQTLINTATAAAAATATTTTATPARANLPTAKITPRTHATNGELNNLKRKYQIAMQRSKLPPQPLFRSDDAQPTTRTTLITAVSKSPLKMTSSLSKRTASTTTMKTSAPFSKMVTASTFATSIMNTSGIIPKMITYPKVVTNRITSPVSKIPTPFPKAMKSSTSKMPETFSKAMPSPVTEVTGRITKVIKSPTSKMPAPYSKVTKTTATPPTSRPTVIPSEHALRLIAKTLATKNSTIWNEQRACKVYLDVMAVRQPEVSVDLTELAKERGLEDFTTKTRRGGGLTPITIPFSRNSSSSSSSSSSSLASPATPTTALLNKKMGRVASTASPVVSRAPNPSGSSLISNANANANNTKQVLLVLNQNQVVRMPTMVNRVAGAVAAGGGGGVTTTGNGGTAQPQRIPFLVTANGLGGGSNQQPLLLLLPPGTNPSNLSASFRPQVATTAAAAATTTTMPRGITNPTVQRPVFSYTRQPRPPSVFNPCQVLDEQEPENIVVEPSLPEFDDDYATISAPEPPPEPEVITIDEDDGPNTSKRAKRSAASNLASQSVNNNPKSTVSNQKQSSKGVASNSASNSKNLPNAKQLPVTSASKKTPTSVTSNSNPVRTYSKSSTSTNHIENLNSNQANGNNSTADVAVSSSNRTYSTMTRSQRKASNLSEATRTYSKTTAVEAKTSVVSKETPVAVKEEPNWDDPNWRPELYLVKINRFIKEEPED